MILSKEGSLITLLLLLFWAGVACGQSPAVAEELGRVAGRIDPGGAECRGRVSLWPVAEEAAEGHSQFYGVPPWSTALNPDCSFSIRAAAGSYYLRAVVRKTPGPLRGPARPGDLLFISPDQDGKPFRVEVTADEVTENFVGSHSHYTVYAGDLEEIETGVTGYLVDPEGKPVSKLIVVAFSDEQMVSRPVAISAPSDEQGRFQLRLRGKSRIYLQAQEQMGVGRITDGQMGGIYGGSVAKQVKVKQGKRIDNLKIVVQRHEKGEAQ